MGNLAGFMSSLNFKKIFLNGASLSLFLILLGGVLLSLYRVSEFDSFNQKNQEIDTIIIGRNVDNFNQESWYGWYNFSIWQIQSKTRLEIGYNYKFKGDITKFDKDQRYQLYNLTTGVTGKIKVVGDTLKNKICNASCLLVQNINSLKSNFQKVYLQNSCHEFYPVISSFLVNSNCSDVAGLSIGLVLGGTDYFSDDLKTNFKKVGLMHIVAVSGFQVGLIMSVVELILRKWLIPRNTRLLIFTLTLSFFIFLFGPEPPVIRSSLSFLISSGSLFLFGRKINGLRALIYSGLAMLLINPFYLYSISFQLSFIASFALIVSFENDLFTFKHLNNFWNLLSSTVATFLYTLPILVSIGSGVSLVAIFTNILIIPTIPFVTGLNILGLIPQIGGFFLMIALVVQTLFLNLVNWLANLLPTANFEPLNTLEMIGYYIVLTAIFLIVPKLVVTTAKPLLNNG